MQQISYPLDLHTDQNQFAMLTGVMRSETKDFLWGHEILVGQKKVPTYENDQLNKR